MITAGSEIILNGFAGEDTMGLAPILFYQLGGSRASQSAGRSIAAACPAQVDGSSAALGAKRLELGLKPPYRFRTVPPQ